MRSPEAPFRGPGWGDVKDYLEACGSRWGGQWVLSVRLAKRGAVGSTLWVLCERFSAPDKLGNSKARRAGHVYPTSDGINMPALMHGLLAEVEEGLQDDRGVAERQASF